MLSPSRLLLISLVSFAPAVFAADDTTKAPAKDAIDSPAVTRVVPAPPPKPTPEVIAVLDKLEKQSKETKTMQAVVRYDLNQTLQGDEQQRFGKIVYESGPPARFAAQFDTLRVDKKSIASKQWFLFDGKWLVHKLDDKKQFFKWQVVAPDAKPEDADPLGLGRGPFVVPVALRKDLLLSKYKVDLIAPDAKADPKNSMHLKLTPLPGQRINFTEIDLWYDRETLLPQRARTMNESETESIIHLSEVVLNGKVEGNPLDTAEPNEKGWEVQVTPWGK